MNNEASSLHDKAAYQSSILNRPQSLANFLPYDEYLKKYRTFVMKDGSLGAVFRISPLSHEPMTENQILKVTKEIEAWFRLPDSFVVQVLYENAYISSRDTRVTELVQSKDQGHPVSALLYQEKLNDLLESSKGKGRNPPMSRSFLLSLRYFPENLDQAGGGKIDKETRKFWSNLQNFDYEVKNLLASSSIPMEQLDAESLSSILRRFFNPISYLDPGYAPINGSLPISDQLIFSTPDLDYQGIRREGLMTRTFTLKCPPSFSYPGGMAQFVELDFPFRVSINISFPPPSKVKKFLATKEFLLENAMSAKARVQKEEVESIQESLAREDRCLQMTFTITVDGSSEEEILERRRRLIHLFTNKLECELIDEPHIGLGLCLNSLPLNYTPDADFSTRRGIRILRSDLASFVPIFDSCKPLGEATSFYFSREQSLVPFSLLGNETSNHTVVLADTGAGKSAFVIDCIQAAKRLEPEPIVFVIDKKSSYGMLSQYYDADITVFDRNRDIPFSPFRGVYNEEKIAFLTRMILTAAKLTSPSFSPESEHQTAITEALKRAYLKKQDENRLEFNDGEFHEIQNFRNVCIGMADVVAELGALTGLVDAKEAAMIRDLATKLKPFYGDGIYAKFFAEGVEGSGKGDCLFYVYDLDALDGDPVLQALMTMAVTEEIRNILNRPENQGRTGFLVMEEFAMLGRNNPAFKDFAIDFAETMRKRGCWLITLTPRPQNYFDLEVGQAFWGVADNFIFLQMSPDNVDYIAQKSKLFDEANTEIIRSLRTKKGEYADIYFMNKSKSRQGAFRFRQTKYDRWMSPTNAKDAARALEALEDFPNKWDALEHLVSNHS